MPQRSDTSRREFLKRCAASAAILPLAEVQLSARGEKETVQSKSRVVITRDTLLRGSTAGSVDSSYILLLLDRGMQSLFAADNSQEPWKKLVRPGQMVGLKVNALGGRGLSTNPQLVEAVCERLQEAGIRANNIVVWDRDTREMEHAGFRISVGGNKVQCFGTDRLGYEENLVTYGSVGSQLSKILTQRCELLINLPILKDHDGAGVTIAMKNMYGVIHNPNKYHPNGCDPFIADLNMLPTIKNKLRLNICDATTAAYEGGPGYKPEYSWKDNSLLLSTDPVALDSVGWRVIERKRAEKGLKTLEAEGRAPRYLATAADAQHRLGTNDPRRIAVIEVSA